MTTDFRALCADLLWALENAIRVIYHEDGTKHISTANPIVNRARAALAAEPAVPDVVGPEWQPCVKLPITVHVREQRPGEQHVSTREGITPVRPDDLVMRGVAGEEYPIGRELFHRTYRMGSADEPAAVTGQLSDEEWDALVERVWDKYKTVGYQGERFMYDGDFGSALDLVRKELSLWGNQPAPPADGEVAELVAWLRETGDTIQPSHLAEHQRYKRAAELLQRQVPVPVSVSERLPEPKDCDAEGRCWWFCPTSVLPNGMLPYWCLGPADPPKSWFTHWLPAHALPLPGVGE